MALQEIDFGTVDDVNTVARVMDDTLSPNATTDFELEVKAKRCAHTVDVYVLLLPSGPPLTIDPPGSDLANKLGVTLTPGQIEKIHMLIKNHPGGTNPATYTLICTTFVDGAFSAVNVFSVPPAFRRRVRNLIIRPWRLFVLMAANLLVAAILILILPATFFPGIAALFLGIAVLLFVIAFKFRTPDFTVY